MSALSEPVSAMLGFLPMMMILSIVGIAISLYLKQGEQIGGQVISMCLILGLLIIFPGLARIIRGIESGDDLLGQPGEEEFNFSVVTKGIEYEKGFLGPKKRYVLILSDGEKYPVPRAVYDLFDTGDSVTITISANRRKITFTELN